MTSRGYSIEEGGRLNNFAVEPKMYVDDTPKTGFTQYAEKLNGRLAMIGFISLISLEAITGQGLVQWLTSL
ncbi:high light inducible protein [Limnoraphis robusta Tam1]|uniref:High light inducible protein n=1 Tax=Limnoraphis robusta CCNP1315 TaxID=3110306 RepID=A0ABU5U4D7_9CYAN|nr:high light inducible protein [Limnoraphis robusta]MEA5522014.1 high light inducible protein [Limnoraphis robusta CCNP1315]MEA5543082.1 high light inducible protein [Limnoraphis robusta Tam1]MEA5545388.1 high light inducible protein [Limnoraphis robusta CCNP1324]